VKKRGGPGQKRKNNLAKKNRVAELAFHAGRVRGAEHQRSTNYCTPEKSIEKNGEKTPKDEIKPKVGLLAIKPTQKVDRTKKAHRVKWCRGQVRGPPNP